MLIQVNTYIVFIVLESIRVQNSHYLMAASSVGKNAIIFGGDMSSSGHIDNKKKHFLISGKGPTQGLDDTALTA